MLTTLVDEVIDCFSLVRNSDGENKVMASTAALARIKKARKWKRYLLSGTVDFFNPLVSFSVIHELLAPVFKAQEAEFRIFTKHPARALEYLEWEMAQFDLWRMPVNLSVVVQLESALDLERLDVFAELAHEVKSVSFVGFRSNPAHPLNPRDLVQRLDRCTLREIVMEDGAARETQDITRADAECMAMIACHDHFSHCVLIV